MKRAEKKYICQGCGYESPKWLGRCPTCGEWNSLAEKVVKEERVRRRPLPSEEPAPIDSIDSPRREKFLTGIGEFDRVLGDGVVEGSLVLIGGDPGIGKSTMVLQAASRLSQKRLKVLYVSGEESSQQTKLRAERLGVSSDSLYVLPETDLEVIIGWVDKMLPELVVIDSIQTVYHPDLASPPGSVSQVRGCAAELMRIAKRESIPVFIIGHVTKEGDLAGPRTLEHMVDTVLYLEGDRHHHYRILRAVKNRFGSTNEIGVFEMRDSGMTEIPNPSQLFLSERTTESSGSAVVCALEGRRPILVEIQALVSPAKYGIPQRIATGTNHRRLVMLLAVLEKRAKLKVGGQDVFINIAGGLRVDEPAADLGTVVAIASNYKERPVDPETVVIGEVGLGGEVRGVGQIDRRVAEAERLGFSRCVIPWSNVGDMRTGHKMDIEGAKLVSEALKELLS